MKELSLRPYNGRLFFVNTAKEYESAHVELFKTPDVLTCSQDGFVMVAEWDGVSRYVIMHKGDYAARNMEYSGWPSITKEQYDEQVAEISDSNLSSN